MSDVEVSRRLERLRRLDACAVSDAADSLKLAPAVTGLLALTTPARLSGIATTVQLAAGPAPTGAPTRHLCTTAIDLSGPHSVIVVEQRTGVEAAGWGGVLSNAAQMKNIQGVIVEGLARDIDEAHQLGFPIYARGATARTARGRIHEAATGEPLRLGDCIVSTGDYIVADRSGVVCIPAKHIDAVLDAAEAISAKEAAMTAQIRAGEPASTVMGATYETLLQRA